MKNISIDNDSYTVPSRWSELKPEHLRELAALLSCGNYQSIRVRFALYLLGLNAKYKNPVTVDNEPLFYLYNQRGKRMYLFSLEQIHSIAEQFSWIWSRSETSEGVHVSVNPMFTHNPVRNIKLRFTTLRGPDQALGNITFIEFVFAETFLYRYHATQSNEWFSRFIAVLWRPLKNGRVLPFNQERIESWSKRTSRINPQTKTLIQWYYIGCKAFLSKKFTQVFSPSQGKVCDPFEGYLQLTSTLSGADPTKAELVRQANLYDTLTALEQMLEAQPKKK